MLYEAARNLLLEEEEEERAKEAKAKEAEKAAGSASAPGAAAEAVEGAPIGASIGAPSAAAPAKTADELNDEFIQKGAFTLSYSTDPSLCTCAGVYISLESSPSQRHAITLAMLPHTLLPLTCKLPRRTPTTTDWAGLSQLTGHPPSQAHSSVVIMQRGSKPWTSFALCWNELCSKGLCSKGLCSLLFACHSLLL